MIKDKLILPRKVRGHGKLELFDERGKLVERVPFENFISPPGWLRIQSRARSALHSGLSSLKGDYGFGDRYPSDPFGFVVLSTDDTAEAPTTERFWKGDLIGWASKTEYSGADVYRGTVNTPECDGGPDFTRWVFDWPTHAAIGTIYSVNWVGLPRLDDGTEETPPLMRSPFWIDNWVNPTPPGSGYFIGGLGQGTEASHGIVVLWNSTTGNDVIQRLDPDDFSVLQTVNIQDSTVGTVYNGVVYDGTNFYTFVNARSTSGATQLVRVDGTTGAITNVGSPFGSSSSNSGAVGMTISSDGTYIYACSSKMQSIRQILKSDGSIVSSNPGDTASYFSSVPSSAYYDFDNDVVWFDGLPFDPTTFDYIGDEWGTAEYSEAYWSDTLTVTRSGFPASGGVVYLGSGRHAFWWDFAGSISDDPWSSSVPGLGTGYRHGLGARTLLGSPVTKNNLQTMKLTYQFDFSY